MTKLTFLCLAIICVGFIAIVVNGGRNFPGDYHYPNVIQTPDNLQSLAQRVNAARASIHAQQRQQAKYLEAIHMKPTTLNNNINNNNNYRVQDVSPFDTTTQQQQRQGQVSSRITNVPEYATLERREDTLKNNLTSTSFCRAVFRENIPLYPQMVSMSLNQRTGLMDLSYEDVECERHIERDSFVGMIPTIAGLLSDDELRYQFTQLACSWYYRPMFEPTKPPCVEQCGVLRDWINNLDLATATPSQLKDKAILETFVWDKLLLSGRCEYSGVYGTSSATTTVAGGANGIGTRTSTCVRPDDFTIFKPIAEAKIKRPQCSEYTGELCRGMLTHYYNDPANPLTTEIDSKQDLVHSFYRLADRDKCLPDFAKFMCSRYVLSCTEVPVQVTDRQGVTHVVKYALPVFTQGQVCQNYRNNCADFRTLLASAIASTGNDDNGELVKTVTAFIEPNCDQPAPLGTDVQFSCDGIQYSSLYQFFPNSIYYRIDLGITQVTVKAQNFEYETQYDQSTLLPFSPSITCPAPLVLFQPNVSSKESQVLDGSCAKPCPGLRFTDNEYRGSSILSIVIATISLLGALFLLASYMCFKEIRHGQYFLQFLLAAVTITAAIAIGSYVRFTDNNNIQATYCQNETDLGNSPSCTIQAFFLQFALLSLSSFFAVSGFDLFLKIVLAVEIRSATQYDYLLNLAYCFWGWTVPLVLTVTAAATKSLGPSDEGLSFCFVHGRENSIVPWATMYLPFIVQLLIGAISLITATYKLIVEYSRAKDGEYQRQMKGGGGNNNIAANSTMMRRSNIRNFIIPLTMDLFFMLYLLFIVAFRVAVFFFATSWNERVTQFTNCLIIFNPITSYVNQKVDRNVMIQECGIKPDTMDIGIWYFFQAFVPAIGLIMFIILGTQKVYYKLWSAMIGYYFNFPRLLVWAATTHQAKIYARRLAKQREEKEKRIAGLAGIQAHPLTLMNQDGGDGGDMAIEAKVRHEAQMVKDRERREQEERQKKVLEQERKAHEDHIKMIAPHLRPMYLVQQRKRRMLPSLLDPEGSLEKICPKPCKIKDIYQKFNISAAPTTTRGGATVNPYDARQRLDDDFLDDLN